MKLIQRTVLVELLLTSLLTGGVVTVVVFMAFLLRQLGEIGGANFAVLRELIVLFLPEALGFTIPFSCLAAASMVFGRMAADRELTALRASGVHLSLVAWPAIWMGLAGTLATMWLCTMEIPESHYQRRIPTDERIKVLVENYFTTGGAPLELEETGETPEKNRKWSISVTGGARGKTLYDMWVVERSGPGLEWERSIQAGSAKVFYDKPNRRLILVLYDYTIVTKGGIGPTGQIFQIEMPLKSMFQRKERDADDLPLPMLVDALDETPRKGKHPKLLEDWTELATEMHTMLTLGLSPVLFVLVGMGMGMLVASSNRLVALLLSLGVVFMGYFPLFFWGRVAGAEGGAPPWIIWLADVMLLGVGSFLLHRVMRR